ncbi:hypothetical protein Pan258_57700 [Symmachiella dynata]|nr:hypothetical protein Pan258_57700 [Symmachiella dynata]
MSNDLGASECSSPDGMKGPLLTNSLNFGLSHTIRGLRTGATSMVSVTRFVGLDYHQHSVQVCVLDETGHPESDIYC